MTYKMMIEKMTRERLLDALHTIKQKDKIISEVEKVSPSFKIIKMFMTLPYPTKR